MTRTLGLVVNCDGKKRFVFTYKRSSFKSGKIVVKCTKSKRIQLSAEVRVKRKLLIRNIIIQGEGFDGLFWSSNFEIRNVVAANLVQNQIQ